MLLQSGHARSNRSAISACAVAIVAAVIVATPTWTDALEPAKRDVKPMRCEQMDHSKMDRVKDMDCMRDKTGTEDMNCMSMTGDADYDFAANMRKHHQMAVDMSQAELENGKNSKMIGMAKGIIAAQKNEIAILDKWMESHKKVVTETTSK